MDERSMSEQKAQTGAPTPQWPLVALIERLERMCLGDGEAEGVMAEVLRGLTGLSEAYHGALWRMEPGAKQLRPVMQVSARATEATAQAWAQRLGEAASAAIESGTIQTRSLPEPPERIATGVDFVAVALPLPAPESPAQCATLAVGLKSGALADARMAMVRLLATLMGLYATRRGAAEARASYRALSGAWALVGEMTAFVRPADMAHVAANRAKAAFQADRATFGFVRRGRVTVAAVSGEDTLDVRSNASRALQAAQTETALTGEPTLFLAAATGEARTAQRSRCPQHDELAVMSGARTIYSVPLRKDKELVAVWTLEFGVDALPQATREVIDVAAGLIGPVLHLAQLNDRPLLRRAGDGAGAAARWVFGKEHPWRRVAVLAAMAVAAFAVFGRWNFDVTGNCVLEPSFRRIYAAPYDTTIKDAPLRPGDTVAEGQLLVSFDRDEIDLQLREAASKRASVEKEMASYLAEQKLAKYAEAQARADALAAEIALLRRHAEKATVKAEFAGLLIRGDLSRDIGRPTRTGQELLEVAPLDKLVLEVAVAQEDVGYLRLGMTGVFATRARPDETIPFTLSKLHPLPETREGENVYVAEAVVPNPEGWLRPGMEGVAKVNVGRRNVSWVASRKLVNWLRLRLWW
jgi:hypothetical protein